MAFDFGIDDVVNLLNLTVRRKYGSNMDVDCPFCNQSKKGKLNVNVAKKVFRCNYCTTSGGILELYGKVHGLNNSESFREISQLMGRAGCNNPAPRPVLSMNSSVETVKQAEPDVLNDTYTLLFSMLTLSDTHKQNLFERGLTEGQIVEHGYKSVPPYGQKKLADKLKNVGAELLGVPGFYKEDDGSFNVNLRASGIIIPIRNIFGLIIGAQIRLDKPFNDKKYIWLSSSNKPNGATSGAPAHFIGDPSSEKVYVTEGSLKGNVAHAISKKTFLCIAGASQTGRLPELLKMLKNNGVKAIVECYDMDQKENEYVKKGSDTLKEIAASLGFIVTTSRWSGDCKGIDDYYLKRKKEALKVKKADIQDVYCAFKNI